MSIYKNVKNACSEAGITIDSSRGKIRWDVNTPGVDKVKAVAEELKKPIEFFLE